MLTFSVLTIKVTLQAKQNKKEIPHKKDEDFNMKMYRIAQREKFTALSID